MAIDMLYQKVHETDQEVRYAYGNQTVDRYLIIYKDREEYLVEDGREDYGTRAVLQGILRRRRETDAWPKGGGVQH